MRFKKFYQDECKLNEVAFNAKKIEKVVSLFSRIMSKKMSGEFKPIGFEKYKRSSGKGKGFRMMNDVGEMLRYNWDEKLSKKSTFELTSIDFWANGNTTFTKPTRTVRFGPNLNVVQVLEEIVDALKTGIIKEARSSAEKQNWLVSKGLPKSLAGSAKAMKGRAEQMGLSSELEVFLGETETNSLENDLQEIEKEFTKEVYANPETVFEDIEDLLSVVARKKWRTLIVCGMGGIGKTYHITEGPRSLPTMLGAEGKAWTYHSGTKAAPFSFYQTLFQERDKVIVFDEADSLLKNPDIIMMLKPILDTSGQNMAEYMSGTRNMVGKSMDEIEAYSQEASEALANGAMVGPKEKEDVVVLPSKFKFTGGMIFISNMRANKIEEAIMSRSIFIDVYLAQKDVVKRIRTIAEAKAAGLGLSKDEANEIVDALSSGTTAKGEEIEITYMTPEYARKSKNLTARAFELAAVLKKSGLTRWAELSQMYA